MAKQLQPTSYFRADQTQKSEVVLKPLAKSATSGAVLIENQHSFANIMTFSWRFSILQLFQLQVLSPPESLARLRCGVTTLKISSNQVRHASSYVVTWNPQFSLLASNMPPVPFFCATYSGVPCILYDGHAGVSAIFRSDMD